MRPELRHLSSSPSVPVIGSLLTKAHECPLCEIRAKQKRRIRSGRITRNVWALRSARTGGTTQRFRVGCSFGEAPHLRKGVRRVVEYIKHLRPNDHPRGRTRWRVSSRTCRLQLRRRVSSTSVWRRKAPVARTTPISIEFSGWAKDPRFQGWQTPVVLCLHQHCAARKEPSDSVFQLSAYVSTDRLNFHANKLGWRGDQFTPCL